MASVATAATVVQAFAAILTFGAAAVAAHIAWKAPQRAAELAERLRLQNDEARTSRAEKLRIFRVLMNHRGRNISAAEPVDALNMIVVAFADAPEVGEAFRHFLEVISGRENARNRSERYMALLATMAATLGFKDVSVSDIDRGYFPAS